MTNWRLMDGVSGRPGNGPSVSAYSGAFIGGHMWKVTQSGLWFKGYWHWVPTGGDTTARKFALWQLTDTTHSIQRVLVPGTTVTSGTLTAGQWNFVALPSPIGLSRQLPYVAAYGYTATAGFPDTQNQFGSGHPYSAGITNGPLVMYSDQTGTNKEPFTSNFNQGLFSTGGSDPSVTFPSTGDVSSNFWIDVEVTDVAPAGASYRLFPQTQEPINWVLDTANNFTLGLEFVLSQACLLDKFWFYSPASVTQLPTRCLIWKVSDHSIVTGTDKNPPTWSGAAGSGWVSATYSTPAKLPAGRYKLSVFNGAGTPAIWNPTTNLFWGTAGVGAGGITNGPISAPDSASATSPGQSTYNLGATLTYPLTYATTPADGPNYWQDIEVRIDPSGSGLLLASMVV